MRKRASQPIKLPGDPTSYLIALRYIDALKEMVTGKDNKTICLSYEATQLLGSLGGIKDFVQPALTKKP